MNVDGRTIASESHARELVRVNRALATFTRATEALVHASDEQQLLNDICRIMVEAGGYLFAWVGYVQHDDERSVWPVARYGDDKGYISRARVNWNELSERGRGPTGEAIRTGKVQLAYTGDSQHFVPWREEALRCGFQSSLSLPLLVEGRVIGVLHLYSRSATPYDQDELHLMEHLCRNIAYGIDMQRMQFERHRAERELKESEGRYRSLVELSPDAIVVHTQGIIIFSNSAANGLFGVTASQPLVGRRLLDLVHPDDVSLADQRLNLDEASGAVEERLVRLDGSYFAAEVTSAPIIFHGVHARQVVIRDITERKQVHAQLVQTAKLATLGEMAAGMAHELSQPTNIMRMAAESALMMLERGKADTAYLVKQFSLIASQTGRMAEIIDHIRIFSRKDTGEVETFDARRSLSLAAELLTPQLQAADVALDCRLPEQSCLVQGRPVQLEQVIINLLSNATDAVKSARAAEPGRKGKVILEARRIAPDSLLVTVTDNGTGIGGQDLDRIFEPFFTTKEVGSGTGLGLSVSFGIINSMGGKLEARNMPDQGAQFRISLPLTQGQAAALAVAAARPVPGEDEDGGHLPGHHVLLVDDEVQATETMAAYLTEMGYKISTAHSGKSALARFEEDPADLVMTDIRMPDGDGEELIRALRALDPDLPIVVVTGHMGATETLAATTNAKSIILLKKPISLPQMVETLEKLISYS